MVSYAVLWKNVLTKQIFQNRSYDDSFDHKFYVDFKSH